VAPAPPAGLEVTLGSVGEASVPPEARSPLEAAVDVEAAVALCGAHAAGSTVPVVVVWATATAGRTTRSVASATARERMPEAFASAAPSPSPLHAILRSQMAPRVPGPVTEAAYTRMPVDKRREQLLELGAELFARHSFAELSMARIAREAGISKALLYHYFPSKRDFFVATLQDAAEQLARRTQPDAELPAAQALSASLDAFLAWVEENELAYRKLMESARSVPEVGELIGQVRDRTSARILSGLGVGIDPPPKLRAAARAWLWFMDGAILDWLDHRDIGRGELRDLLLGSLAGSLEAAGGGHLLVR
jgi:AcrR family transcriptional regulator